MVAWVGEGCGGVDWRGDIGEGGEGVVGVDGEGGGMHGVFGGWWVGWKLGGK